ncbi:MAG: fluoride efflux transporter CrcB [Bacteroidetes bacterium]|nr:fluoride efflux transporter CrcB [Bacteroidota bacterium]
MIKILYIGFGGFFGSIARFLTAKFVNNIFPNFPFGTLVVNVAGSFVLGFLLYSVAYGKNISSDLRDMIAVGFIGAFTTMSTFAYESFRLGELGEWVSFSMNLFLNLFLCILFVYLGKELAVMIAK